MMRMDQPAPLDHTTLGMPLAQHLEPGSIPLDAITVVRYLDADGALTYSALTTGQHPLDAYALAIYATRQLAFELDATVTTGEDQ